MKLLYCQDCRDIVQPHQEQNRPRSCRCGRHSIWRSSPISVSIHDAKPTGRHCAFVIVLANLIALADEEQTSPATLDRIRRNTSLAPAGRSARICSRIGSPVAKFRPGATIDTAWAKELPATAA